MDVLWNGCLTAVAVMMAVPALAILASGVWRRLTGARRRPRTGRPLRLRLPLRENPAQALARLRESLGLHG